MQLAPGPFLGDRRNQATVWFEYLPSCEAAPILRARRLASVEQPVVDPELAVKPHRMIKTCPHNALVEQRTIMRS